MNKYELPTPAVIVDLDQLERNIRSMAQAAQKANVKLRPHVKTHKMTVIAKMQMEAGAAGITCAKVSEAEVMARAGIRDILIAYPIVGEHPIRKMTELLDEFDDCRIIVAFDSVYGAQKINEAAARKGKCIELYMIVNTGLDRDGVAPGQEALELAQQISGLRNVALKGIMTHEGHVYKAKTKDELLRLSAEAWRQMAQTAELLRSRGIRVDEVSVGSTPACRLGTEVEGVTEWRPGTYVFNDWNEMTLATPYDECALTVLSTVVSHPAANRFILDAGSKTLAADKSLTNGYGLIKEAPDAVIERLSEEHAVVISEKSDTFRIGQQVEIIPNHVCPVINLTDSVYVARGGNIVGQWNVEARGKNI